MPVIAINNALREGEATAEEQDMLIATEAMEVREELEELLHVHVFDNWQERCQRAVVGQNLTLAVSDVHAGACVPVTLVLWRRSSRCPGWSGLAGGQRGRPCVLIINCIYRNNTRHSSFPISDQRFTVI